LKRQAIKSLGGYVYQLYQTLYAWLSIPDDAVLFIEVAEDFMVALRDCINQVQVKNTAPSTRVTLRNASVLSLIDSHLSLVKENSLLKVQSVYLTTASIASEQSSSFPDKMPGLFYWKSVSEGVSPLEPLKRFLLEQRLTAATKEFLGTNNDSLILDKLISSVTWHCDADDFASVQRKVSVETQLGADIGYPPVEARRLFSLIGG
jgi:hypothetical protein